MPDAPIAYRVPLAIRLWIWVLLPVFVVFFIVRGPASFSPVLVLSYAIFLAAFWYAYWYLTWSVAFDGSTLTWRSALRRMAAPAADIERVVITTRSPTLAPVRIRMRSGQTVALPIGGTKSVRFVRDLAQRVPAVPVDEQ